MKPNWRDLRERVITTAQSGRQTLDDIALTFGVSASTVDKWYKRRRETDSVAVRPFAAGRKRALQACEDWLQAPGPSGAAPTAQETDRTAQIRALHAARKSLNAIAVVCGADGGTEVEAFGKIKKKWLKSFLALPKGIPSHDTFGRVFAALDAAPCSGVSSSGCNRSRAWR
jgi:transposase-like protein